MPTICLQHECAPSVDRNGVWVIETRGPEHRPYKVYRCDLYRCPVGGEYSIGGWGTATVEGSSAFTGVLREALSGNDGPTYYSHEVPAYRPTCDERGIGCRFGPGLGPCRANGCQDR